MALPRTKTPALFAAPLAKKKKGFITLTADHSGAGKSGTKRKALSRKDRGTTFQV
jgi:hypothetical protein